VLRLLLLPLLLPLLLLPLLLLFLPLHLPLVASMIGIFSRLPALKLWARQWCSTIFAFRYIRDGDGFHQLGKVKGNTRFSSARHLNRF
jgi:hypothetical protein